MHKIPTPLYDHTTEEIDRRVAALTLEAARMSPGEIKQSLLRQAAKFRAYSEMKRWASQKAPARRKGIDL
jgi:hypothetical protein